MAIDSVTVEKMLGALKVDSSSDVGATEAFAAMLEQVCGVPEEEFVRKSAQLGSDERILVSSYRSVHGCASREEVFIGLHLVIRRLRSSQQARGGLIAIVAFGDCLLRKLRAPGGREIGMAAD